MTPRGAERAVALLPIKGYSDRITGKNFKDFCGKPLFRWILDTLLSLPEIGLVVINTDARTAFEELGVHRMPRVQLRDRKAELCGDLVSMNLILEDDIARRAGRPLRHDARDKPAARRRDDLPGDRGLSRQARPRRSGFVVHGQPVPVTVLWLRRAASQSRSQESRPHAGSRALVRGELESLPVHRGQLPRRKGAHRLSSDDVRIAKARKRGHRRPGRLGRCRSDCAPAPQCQCTSRRMKVLVTCPPMLRNLDEFRPRFERACDRRGGPQGGANPHGGRTDPAGARLRRLDHRGRSGDAGGLRGGQGRTPQGRREVGCRRGQRRPRGGASAGHSDHQHAVHVRKGSGRPRDGLCHRAGPAVRRDRSRRSGRRLAEAVRDFTRGPDRGAGRVRGYRKEHGAPASRRRDARARVRSGARIGQPTAGDRSGGVAGTGGGGGLHRADLRPDTRDAPHAGLHDAVAAAPRRAGCQRGAGSAHRRIARW